jgi:hypothetical protein
MIAVMAIADQLGDTKLWLLFFFSERTKVEQAPSDLKAQKASLNLAYVRV